MAIVLEKSGDKHRINLEKGGKPITGEIKINLVMSEKVCKILLVLFPMLGKPKHGEICDVDISLPFYLIFHSPKYGSRLAYVPSVFSLATDPNR